MTDSITAHGVAVGIPRGWEAELGVLESETIPPAPGELAVQSATEPMVLLHLANFPLPADRGDYGSGAVEIMDSGSILIVLGEFDRASAGTALFAAEGMPRELSVDDFDPSGLQRPQFNRTATQHFFHVGDRAFCLYVVLGSHRARPLLVPEVNRLLVTIDIA